MQVSPGVAIPIDPASHPNVLFGISIFLICLGFAWLTYLARLYTRFFIVRTLGFDDLFMGITLVRSLRKSPADSC